MKSLFYMFIGVILCSSYFYVKHNFIDRVPPRLKPRADSELIISVKFEPDIPNKYRVTHLSPRSLEKGEVVVGFQDRNAAEKFASKLEVFMYRSLPIEDGEIIYP